MHHRRERGRHPKERRQYASTVHLEFTHPTARSVSVAGSFNDWRPAEAQMILQRNGKWSVDIRLPPGTYEYRLVVDGKWMPDPNADHTTLNAFGEWNSVLTVRRRVKRAAGTRKR